MRMNTGSARLAESWNYLEYYLAATDFLHYASQGTVEIAGHMPSLCYAVYTVLAQETLHRIGEWGFHIERAVCLLESGPSSGQQSLTSPEGMQPDPLHGHAISTLSETGGSYAMDPEAVNRAIRHPKIGRMGEIIVIALIAVLDEIVVKLPPEELGDFPDRTAMGFR
jgi:hypothetical protein